MNTKVCSKCGETKSLDDYQTDKSKKDGKYSSCKLCVSFLKKSYREENKEKIKERKKESYKKNVEKISIVNKEYREHNKEKLNEYNRLYYNVNKKVLLEKNKEYRKKQKDKLVETYKSYKKKNELKITEYQKKYRLKHSKKLKKYLYEYKKNRRANDILFYLRETLSHRIRTFLKTKNIDKKNTTMSIVGCTPNELRDHIQKQFKEGMSWENRNKWHIDHIIPLSSAKDEKMIYELCHFTNLQPLWIEENLKKGNKIIKNDKNIIS
jgi:hypothetical protein